LKFENFEIEKRKTADTPHPSKEQISRLENRRIE
jgi:hypothetical protein